MGTGGGDGTKERLDRGGANVAVQPDGLPTKPKPPLHSDVLTGVDWFKVAVWATCAALCALWVFVLLVAVQQF